MSTLRCEADVLFPRLRLAVFVNGCFWHACPLHASWPVANADFWETKIRGNRARDERNDALLTEAGWTIVRLWEHQSLDEMVATVREQVDRLREHLR